MEGGAGIRRLKGTAAGPKFHEHRGAMQELADRGPSWLPHPLWVACAIAWELVVLASIYTRLAWVTAAGLTRYAAEGFLLTLKRGD